MASHTGLGLSIAWSLCILGWTHYQRNELAALVRSAQGDEAAAIATLQEAVG